MILNIWDTGIIPLPQEEDEKEFEKLGKLPVEKNTRKKPKLLEQMILSLRGRKAGRGK